MQVTKIHYQLLERKNNSYPLAKCSVILDDCLKLDEIRIYDGAKGKYVTFPGKFRFQKDDDGNRRLVVDKGRKNEYYHPVDKGFAKYLKDIITEGYTQLFENGVFVYEPKDSQYIELEASDGGEEGIKILQGQVDG